MLCTLCVLQFLIHCIVLHFVAVVAAVFCELQVLFAAVFFVSCRYCSIRKQQKKTLKTSKKYKKHLLFLSITV